MNNIDNLTENKKINQDTQFKTKGAFGFGIGSALVAGLCCLVPLIAILIGLGSITSLLSLTRYRPYFLALSLILLAITLWWNWQRNKKCCQTKQERDRLINITFSIAIIYAIILGLLNFGLPKILASYQKTVASKQNAGIKEARINLQVSGLTCPTCPETFRQILKKEKGVKEASFTYPNGKGYVIYKKGQISKEKIINIIKKAGYKVKSN